MTAVDVSAWQTALGLRADGDFGPATLAASMALIKPVAPGHRNKLANPIAFFDAVRAKFGPLSQRQVDGFRSLLDVMSVWPKSWVAYGLATTWHETARTMQPIKEMGGPDYFFRMYDKDGARPKVAASLGNTEPGDGVKFYGRGYVQITGRTNYTKYGITSNPDDALKSDVAGRILVDGMTKGVFTGKKLSDYLPGDYVNARRIINGTDKAESIAGYAQSFETALSAGAWS